MSETSPLYHYRRTETDMVIDFAEELQAESNVVGRARHEPLPDAPIEYIKPGVMGIEYPRTLADERAELEADRVSDKQWDTWAHS